MAYCSASDISKDFGNLGFDSQSRVRDTDLTEFIADADALINSYLGARYSVPIVGTEALKVVKLYSRSLVADKVAGILRISQGSNQAANQNVRSGLSTKDVLAQLADLRDGNAQLPSDAVLAKEHGGLASFNVKNGRKPEFKKDEQQW